MAARFASNLFVLLAGAALYLHVLGRVRLRAPRLESWLEGEGPALDSPPLAAGIRGEGLLPAVEPGR